ncbi:MAG: valine--tRNA ligase [Chloroflexi bacterium]|nr:valine--tRNA ligase [Chloroflexota bacterium]
MSVDSAIPKAYDPKLVEARWYAFWMEKGYFKPRIDPNKPPFTIIMPPPNVTGELHLGHALTATIEDIMVRWHRMRGDPTLWLPGRDHAGIAAQVVVERQIAQQGLSRQRLGREKFLEKMWEWMNEYGRRISEQHKRLGASCDWSRERFTLDDGPSKAVRTTFVRLYHKGLIYRGERIINWCPRCVTALSDLEVDHRDVNGNLWYVRYQLEGEDSYITVATTRPETILGDTAVAVNPQDERYTGMVGKKAILPVIGRAIPIIADDAVDRTFGTGAVKVTPAHDPVDFEIGQRHGLPTVNILNPDGTLNANAGPYRGSERFACRKALVAQLEKDGLLVKIEPHSHAVGHCQRCGTVVEPWASKQWFVKIAPLAAPAIQAVVDRRIKIIPERFTKVYLNWMENIRDWCISRQLWWGHRIPVWYCEYCHSQVVPDRETPLQDPGKCPKCGNVDLAQDPDVLDTWFSSGLWPHSTLGWPEQTEDLKHFYPTSVMETGYDILFFWVARMIIMGIENTGDVPFRTVYLHGLIRDERGEKMSKMKGNVLNPLELVEQYGTDALRFAVSTGTSPGNDIRLSASKLESSRNFVNKIWNAARFVMRSVEANPEAAAPEKVGLSPQYVQDRWILSRLNHLVESVNAFMADYQFGEAERQIHDFLWGEYCDWYIEMAKVRLRDPAAASPLPTLVSVLETSLRLLHPYMPFVTEEIWQNLGVLVPEAKSAESIMIATYPTADSSRFDPGAEAEMESVMEIVRSIRNARAELRIEPERWLEATLYAKNSHPSLASQSGAIETLARVRPLSVQGHGYPHLAKAKAAHETRDSLVLVLSTAEVVLPLAGVLDMDKERARIKGEVGELEADIGRLTARLEDEAFVDKAPPAIVEQHQEKLTGRQDRLARLRQLLEQLG